MDLRRLTLCAIGPYAGEFAVDFEALGASGVFLLEGPTGSGKSTVIDAIVFALYGGLAGSSSSDDRLHSHHARPEAEPFVELVFETAAGIHRIRRTPAWNRPKTRGTGTTKVNSTVSLLRLTSPDAQGGEAVSSRAQEVGAEIQRIVGLTKDQFLQTIVLPQGEFARFLGASGEDRRLVLQSLFGTEIYDGTTDELVLRRRSAHAAVDASEAAVTQALAGLRGASGDSDPIIDVESAVAAVTRFADEAAEAARFRDAARLTRDAAAADHDAQNRLAAALSTRARLVERRSALASGRDAADVARTEAAAARRAATVTPAATAVAATEAAVDRATAALAEVDARHPKLANETLAALVSRRDDLLGEIATTSGLVELEAAFPGRDARVAQDRETVRALRERVAADGDSLAGRDTVRDATVDDTSTEAHAQSGLEAAERAVVAALATQQAVVRRDALATASAQATEEAVAAGGTARAALDRESQLRHLRIDGMAGELAGALVAGTPCVVCGSLEHPAPAVLVREHPTDDDIAAAEHARAEAESALTVAGARSATAAARLDDATAVAGDLSEVHADVAVEAARGAVDDARRAVEALATSRSELARFDTETDRLRQAQHKAEVSLATTSSRVEAESAAVEADRASLASSLGDRAASAADLRSDLGRAETAVASVIAARNGLDRSLDSRATRRLELQTALDDSGFETAEAAVAATRSAIDLLRLDDDVALHERESAIVTEGLAAPDIAALTGDEVAHVESSASTLAERAAEYEAVAAVAATRGDRAARSARALTDLEAAVVRRSSVADESRAIVRMADVAGATGPENLRGVTLGTYVLLRRFDDVVAAANSRLGVMSSGRFQLEASETRETGSRSRKTGLALAIHDNATGTTRDPKSFSGGETFYASLSLALGLADVVQAESGGIDLGTLFVDEGFGSLDPETLDVVMTELGRLSAGGRVVGIVSHVDELKQRIADRIEVRRRPDGSSELRSTVSG